MQVIYKQSHSAEGIELILHLTVIFIEMLSNRREWETFLQCSNLLFCPLHKQLKLVSLLLFLLLENYIAFNTDFSGIS